MLRLLAVIACVLASSQAWAHAVLLDTTPPDGAVLNEPPAAIVMRFNEPVAPVALRVVDAVGRDLVAAGAARSQDRELRLDMPALAAGDYVVSWRVVSADSHPIGGAFVFSVGNVVTGAPGAPPDDAEREAAWTVALIITRVVLYAALLFAAGGALVGALVLAPLRIEPRFARGGRCTAVVLAAGAALLAIGFKGGQLGALPLAALADGATWALGFRTSLAASAALIVVGLAMLLAAGRLRRYRAPAEALAATVALAGLGLTGHTATATGAGWGRGLALLHALCAAFWLGAFVPLLRLLPAHPAAALAAARRFSGFAMPAVLLLASSGALMATTRVADLEALTGSLYGRLLLGKLLLVVLLLAIAAANRWWTTPALAAGRRGATGDLANLIRIELALGATIMAVTAVLAHTPPPAIEVHDHATAEPVYAVWTSQGERSLVLEVSPARAGANTVVARLLNPRGEILMPLEMSASFAAPAHGIEAITRPLARSPGGAFRLERLDLPLAGAWSVRIDALVSDFEKAVFETEIALR